MALDQAASPGEGVALGSKQVDVQHEKVASQEQDALVFPYGLVLQNNKNTKRTQTCYVMTPRKVTGTFAPWRRGRSY